MNKSSGAAWLTYICFTWLVWISAWDCTNAAHGQVFSFACSSDHMVSLCLTCKHMLNSKNVDKFGLKHAFNWKKRCSLIGSVSAQRHLLHLSELIFFWRKGRKYNFICPLKIIPPSGPGTRVKQSISQQQNKLCSSGPLFSGIKGLLLRPQVLSDHEGQCSVSEWTMANENKGEVFKTYFSIQSKKQKSCELILLPSNFISFLNCFAQPLMTPGLPYIWRLTSF